ncbi:hypothetical protein DOY81_008159, partial [Sarcophaga bullata]
VDSISYALSFIRFTNKGIPIIDNMNTFLTIMCLALVACAVAKPGYNYPEPQQSFLPSASINNGGIVTAQQSQQLNSFSASANGAQYAPQSQYVANVPHYTVSSTIHNYQKPQQQVIVNKEFFIHSAPEETEVIGEDNENPIAIRQNYRVVFIKAPAQNVNLNLHALKQAQAANEEKTVIYVLSKKPDLTNIQSQLVNTPQEANRAQQEIQSQYDALGGSTRISNEVVAPVRSVIGGKSALGGINIGSVGSSFVLSGSNGGNSATLFLLLTTLSTLVLLFHLA